MPLALLAIAFMALFVVDIDVAAEGHPRACGEAVDESVSRSSMREMSHEYATTTSTLLQEEASRGFCRGRGGRCALDHSDACAAGAVGGRFGDGNIAVRGAGLAMDPAARSDHGSDPRPLRLPVLGNRSGDGGHVGDREAKMKREERKADDVVAVTRQRVRTIFLVSAPAGVMTLR